MATTKIDDDGILIAGVIGGTALIFAIDGILNSRSSEKSIDQNTISGADGIGQMWVNQRILVERMEHIAH